MKTLKLIALSLLLSGSIIAQSFSVPKNYELKTASDYEKYEHTMIECADWLMATPLGQQTAKRKKAYKFVLDYVMGSPKIQALINSKATPYLNNSHLMVIYLASWSKSCLTQNYVNNKEEFTLRATRDAMKYYTSNKATIGKAKKMKKFIKLESQGKLDQYITSKM